MNDMRHPHDHSHGPAAPASPVDPVCGMTVAADSPRRFDFDGTTYLFCSDHCLKKFSADPGKYVVKPDHPAREDVVASRGDEAASAGVIYTCPMHPEIRQAGPGHLSQVRHGARARDAERRRRTRTRSCATSAGASGGRCRSPAVVSLLAMFGHRVVCAARPRCAAGSSSCWRAPVVLWAGWPFFARCVAVDPHAQPEHVDADRHSASAAAYLYSVRRDDRARDLSRPSFDDARPRRRLFRGGGGDRLAHAARAGARAARALADVGRDPRAARPRAEDRATPARRRHRGGRAARPRARRRSPARAPRREGARSTASCWRAARASTSRCSPASPMPVEKGAGDRAHRRHASTAPAAS